MTVKTFYKSLSLFGWRFLYLLVIPIFIVQLSPRAFGLSITQQNLFNSGIYYFDAEASSCTISTAQLSSKEQQAINQNVLIYQQAAQQTNVPWQLLAAIHYRETNLSTTSANLFQITGYKGPSDLLSQAIAAGEFLNGLINRNLPNHRQPLQQTSTDPEEIKDTLYSYNGRADIYAQRAQQLGFSSSTQPYEGSPYVMNNFDLVHTNMGIITRDYGSIDGIDTRLGAFTVYSILLGASAICNDTTLPSGTVQQLAQRLLDNPKITFDYGSRGYVAKPFKDLAAGQLASNNNSCAPTQVSISILQEILLLAEKHTVNISSLTTDHSCNEEHTLGRAVDINILDGQHLGSGTTSNQTSLYNTQLSNTLMTDALPALPSGSSFGDCDGSAIPTNGKKITFFPDNCNHVHTHVPPEK